MNFKETIQAAPTIHEEELKQLNWLPRGSALITTSGNLASKGIRGIVQAATGSMNNSPGIPEYYQPTFQSVENSIVNGFGLMKVNGFNKMAVPFIGGSIFLKRIMKKETITAADKKTLAKCIIDSCFKSAKAGEFVLVTYPNRDSPTDYEIFSAILEEDYPSVDKDQVLKNGDITQFSLHRCDVIMNAANMEVRFGGGLSGVIGNASGQQYQIDTEAQKYIKAYWRSFG